MELTAPHADFELPPWADRLIVVFWWFFALATVILLPGREDPEQSAQLSLAVRLLVSPLMPLFAWFVLHAIRHPVRALIRGLGLPRAARFAAVAAACGITLAVKFAAHGAASGASPWPWGVSVAAYFLVFAGLLVAWLVLRSIWALSYQHVFWIGGLAFALVEENHAALATLARGDPLGAALLLAYLLPIYGLPFAAVFMLVPQEDLPRARLRPGLVACAACALVPLALYKYWGIAWHCLPGSAHL